jgi:hypothetical protein
MYEASVSPGCEEYIVPYLSLLYDGSPVVSKAVCLAAVKFKVLIFFVGLRLVQYFEQKHFHVIVSLLLLPCIVLLCMDYTRVEV